MSAVTAWTGAETRALRVASRLSVRAFAEHRGVAVRTVSKWEAGGSCIVPRPDTQAVLDTVLVLAEEDVRTRFRLLCTSSIRPTPAPAQLDVARTASLGSVELLEIAARTDLGTDSLSDIERTIDTLARGYFEMQRQWAWISG